MRSFDGSGDSATRVFWGRVRPVKSPPLQTSKSVVLVLSIKHTRHLVSKEAKIKISKMSFLFFFSSITLYFMLCKIIKHDMRLQFIDTNAFEKLWLVSKSLNWWFAFLTSHSFNTCFYALTCFRLELLMTIFLNYNKVKSYDLRCDIVKNYFVSIYFPYLLSNLYHKFKL